MEREILAGAIFLPNTPSGATSVSFSEPLIYFPSLFPDTLSVEFNMDGEFGTRFLMDDLILTSSVGLDGSVLQDAFQIYPNPLSSEFCILAPSQAPQQVRSIAALGQVKWTGQVQGDAPAPECELLSRLYLDECTDLS